MTPEAPPTRAASAAECRAERAAATRPEELLLVGTSAEVLARVVPGDPLGLRPRVARHLAGRALFLDADRVHLAAVARVARAALRWRGSPDLDTWLAARVDEAAEAERAAGPDVVAGDALGALQELGAPLGLDPGELARVLRALNHRPEAERRALRALLVEDADGDRVHESEVARAEALAAGRRALTAALDAAAASGDGAIEVGEARP